MCLPSDDRNLHLKSANDVAVWRVDVEDAPCSADVFANDEGDNTLETKRSSSLIDDGTWGDEDVEDEVAVLLADAYDRVGVTLHHRRRESGRRRGIAPASGRHRCPSLPLPPLLPDLSPQIS
eukprot:TRINITY_DN2202_c1_g1_i2.p2 TRINITY_DN2202_c1_g1~~TRINITY_DN2202_c1_g1_i2.p2  ORF type:complete len:122 (-),score=15.76 TRINITY_DN2202_c1_g1_i2:441-806(-)